LYLFLFPPLIVAAIDEERARKSAADKKKKEDDAAGSADDKKSEEDEKKKDDDKDDDSKKEDETDHSKPLLPQLHAKFTNAQSYGLDKIGFGMIASAYDTIESVTFLLLGFFPYCWDKSVEIGNTKFGWSESNDEIKITLIFLAFVTIIGTITSLPFELYSTFEIERKHGFNKQTIGLFVVDKIKGLLLTFLIGGPFFALLLYIIKKGGEYFYLYVWGFMFVFSVFMMTIVPVFIMPLFNKYEPLDDGPLKTSIYALAEQLKYPLTKLFVMDGSKRSAHSNAFMFGFGNNKRIVVSFSAVEYLKRGHFLHFPANFHANLHLFLRQLYDTLLQQVSNEEILAILGHELGESLLFVVFKRVRLFR